MTAAYGTYQVLVDWENTGGLNLYDFETGVQGWYGLGSNPAVVSQSTTQVHEGTYSLKVVLPPLVPFTFNDAARGFDTGMFGPDSLANPASAFTFNDALLGFDTGTFGWSSTASSVEPPGAYGPAITGLTMGHTYTISGHIFGSTVVAVSLGFNSARGGGGSLFSSTLSASWQAFSFTFVAPDTVIYPYAVSAIPASSTTFYLDNVIITSVQADITSRTLSKRTSITFKKGRDQSRSLSPVTSAETSIEVQNRDSMLSPNNTGSVLAGSLLPGRDVLLRNTYGGVTYNLFRGHIDDYAIDPYIDKQSVTFSAGDALALLAETHISTDLWQGLRTGGAIGKVLDYAGWPADKRDLDTGATVIAWWWEEGVTALEAIQKLVDSEGLPAMIGVDGAGRFTFRDRTHRIVRTASRTSQATFRPTGTEPLYSAPFQYNLGWKDLINSATFDVTPRIGLVETQSNVPDDGPRLSGNGVKPAVWSTPETISIPVGQIYTFTVSTTDPFLNAQVPVGSYTGDYAGFNDYTLIQGAVSIQLSRASGQSLNIYVTSTSGTAIVQGMQIRADSIVPAPTSQVASKDTVSVALNKERTFTGQNPVWANANDAQAIADAVVGQRASALPTVSFTLNNGDDARMVQMMTRQLSDRIHVIEPQSFTDDDFYIESIEHTISEAGKRHVVEVGCERAPNSNSASTFTFDSVTAGFDTGKFGYSGVSDPLTAYILDSSLLDAGTLVY